MVKREPIGAVLYFTAPTEIEGVLFEAGEHRIEAYEEDHAGRVSHALVRNVRVPVGPHHDGYVVYNDGIGAALAEIRQSDADFCRQTIEMLFGYEHADDWMDEAFDAHRIDHLRELAARQLEQEFTVTHIYRTYDEETALYTKALQKAWSV